MLQCDLRSQPEFQLTILLNWYSIDDMTGAAGREEEAVNENLPHRADGDQLVLQVELATLSLMASPGSVAALRVFTLTNFYNLNIISSHSTIDIIIITCWYSGLESSEFKMNLHSLFLFLPALGTMKVSWVGQTCWPVKK